MSEQSSVTLDLDLLTANPGMVVDLFKRLKVTMEHATLKLPTAPQVVELLRQPDGREKLRTGLQLREQLIQAMEVDPLRHGHEFSTWKDADDLLAGTYRRNPMAQGGRRLKDLLISGGNRAAKSEYAAKRCVEKLVSGPNKNVWCLSTTNKSSIRDQQKYIWKFLPPEWKALNMKKGGKARITYNQKDGFADSAFVCPNGSEVQFMNYKQDRDVIEGGQVDLWWGDELIPADWVVTLRGRTIDRHGQGIVTFTPIRGCTPTVAEYLTGARVVEWTDCELLPDQKLWDGGALGKIPYIMECLNPEYAIIFFQSRANVFIDYEELKKLWSKRSRGEILVRLHGLTDKRTGTVFPRYGVHNIIAHDKIPKEGTNYWFGDFAWNRKWFMLWFRVWEVNGKKRIFIYREWPDLETYGEWALPSETPDGERGPAQETLGYSIDDYKRMVLVSEGHRFESARKENDPKPEEMFYRYGDPRSGAVQSLQEEQTTTIFDMLNNDGNGLPGMEVKPVAMTGARRFIGEGVNLINSWLQYDDDKPIGVDNEPILYISDKCRNIQECLKLWTGAGGEKGAAKDPVDLLRYAAVMDIEYVPPGALQITGGMG